MGLKDERDVAHLNPDCREGKHRACRGDAWSVSADKPMDCACSCHRSKPTTCAVCERRSLALDLILWGEVLLCREHAPAEPNLKPLTKRLTKGAAS